MQKSQLTMVVAGALVAGGAAAVLLFSGTAGAASPTPAASAAAASSAAATPAASAAIGHGMGGPGFGMNETVSDASVVAKAIGITEAQLNTALSSGQTVAAIAKAHSVDPQKVIDALVADGLDELAAQVKAGTITQAQADARKAAVTQRATEQVNGTFAGGHGMGGTGFGGPRH